MLRALTSPTHGDCERVDADPLVGGVGAAHAGDGEHLEVQSQEANVWNTNGTCFENIFQKNEIFF